MSTKRLSPRRCLAMFLAWSSLLTLNGQAVESYDNPMVGTGTSYSNPFSPNADATVTPAHGTLLTLNLAGGSASQTAGIWDLSCSGGASISLLGIGLLESAPSTKLLNGNLEFDLTAKPDSLLGYLGTGVSLQYNWAAKATFNNPEIIALRPYSSYQVSFAVDGSNGLLKSVLGLVPTFTFQLLDNSDTPIVFDTQGTLINIIGLLGTGVPTGTVTLTFSTGATVPSGPLEMLFKAKALLGTTALGLGKDFATVSNLKLRSNTSLSVGDLVWNDANANGLNDASEVGLSGIGVKIYYSVDGVVGNSDDLLMDATTTDALGKYRFIKLPHGKYYIKATPPAAYPLSSPPVVTADNQVNNDNNGYQPGGQGTMVLSPMIDLLGNTESVSDGDADPDTELTIDFGLRECDVIVITPPVLPAGNVQTAYSSAMSATGGAGVYSWSMIAGTLSTGLSFSTSGVVSGVPADLGTFVFVVQAVDTHGCVGMQSVSLTIRPLPIVHALAMDSFGRYLTGGEFYEVNGVTRVNLARLNRDGTLDESFIPLAPNGPVYCIEVRGSAIYVGGGFTEWGGESHRYLVKLNEDGSRDSGFSIAGFSTAASDCVRAISKNGFYVAGHFSTPGKGVAAVDPSTGALIAGFQPTGPNSGTTVHDVVYDGSRVVVGGNFSTFNGAAHRGIAALTTAGALDSNWPASAAANDDVRTLARADNSSSILAGGAFTTYGGTSGLTGAASMVAATGQFTPTFAGTATLAMGTICKVSLP